MKYQRKKIKGYPDYEIDTVGNVFTTKAKVEMGVDGKMSVRRNTHGYHQVQLYHEGRVHQKLVHRLMWETLVGDIPKDMTIDHIDNDHTNNSLSNLQLLSKSDNSKKSWDNRGRSKIKPIVRDWLGRGYSRKFIAENLGISQSYVSMISREKR